MKFISSFADVKQQDSTASLEQE